MEKALEKLHQLQSQAKLWATQTRITAQTEIQILLSKLNTCIEQAERKITEHGEQIQSLLHEKQQMQAKLCTNDSAQLKYRAKIDELNGVVCSAQEQIQSLSNSMKV